MLCEIFFWASMPKQGGKSLTRPLKILETER